MAVLAGSRILSASALTNLDPRVRSDQHAPVDRISLTTVFLLCLFGISFSPEALCAAPGDGTAVRSAPGEGPGNQSRGVAPDTREQDVRALVVESNLKDINRSLERVPEQAPPPAAAADCPPRCPPRAAPIPPDAKPKEDSALRGNLHRLRREVVADQTPDLRQARVEETLDQDARTETPTQAKRKARDQ